MRVPRLTIPLLVLLALLVELVAHMQILLVVEQTDQIREYSVQVVALHYFGQQAVAVAVVMVVLAPTTLLEILAVQVAVVVVKNQIILLVDH